MDFIKLINALDAQCHCLLSFGNHVWIQIPWCDTEGKFTALGLPCIWSLSLYIDNSHLCPKSLAFSTQPAARPEPGRAEVSPWSCKPLFTESPVQDCCWGKESNKNHVTALNLKMQNHYGSKILSYLGHSLSEELFHTCYNWIHWSPKVSWFKDLVPYLTLLERYGTFKWQKLVTDL